VTTASCPGSPPTPAAGYEVAHVTLHRPVPYAQGFEVIRAHLGTEGRPQTALCGIELRSGAPFSFQGFGEFNAEYARILEGWGLFVEGINPVARTNVAPAVALPPEPVLYGFSYSRPCDPSLPPTFVVAGAVELPEGVLEAGGIFRAGDTSPGGIAARARFVMDRMENRLRGLGGDWPDITTIDVYTIHPIEPLLPEIILGRAGAAATHGIRWFYSRPPIVGIEYEMDLPAVRTESRLD
jgi:hypothetical protein